ncbi:enterobactin exporter EntS [mine drainage metagenome]|uniref:Enterobactin exporter EntS n=1 Tax=mine drainage metagenome TaxID=410659 RepID=A0A1J5PYL2_9ZZZZ
MDLKRTLGPLREPSFAHYFTAVVISQAGSYASGIALSFAVLAASNPTALGLIFLSREIPILILLLAGGVFADRLPRRFVLAGASFTQGASQLVGAGILIHGHANIFALSCCAAVNGAANAFAMPATTGLIPQVVSGARLQQANALLGLTPRLIGIAGAALGAWLISSIGAGYALAFDSITFVVAGALLVTVAKDVPRVKRETSPIADLGEGWREVRSRTWLWVMILCFGAFQLAYFPALMVIGPEIARTHLGGPSAWASIITGELVGGIIGGAISFKVRFPRPLLLANLISLPIVAQLVGFAMGWPLSVLVVLTMFAGLSFSIGGMIWFTTLQRLIPSESLSRVSSFDWFGSLALTPIGYAIIGPLSSAIGERATMGFSAALLALAILLPLAVPAVGGLQLPPIEPVISPEKETDPAS